MNARSQATLATASSNRYAYDSNRIKTLCVEMSGTQAYTQAWTVDNWLASVIKSDLTGTILATTTIGYDGDGMRVKKSDPSGTTYYLGTVEVLITGTTQLTTSFYAFGGALVAMRTAATATQTYLHGDHLGSVSLTTNAAGQKVSEQRYKPYGEVRWTSGAGLPSDFTFTSQRESSYGTIFMSARPLLFHVAGGRLLVAQSLPFDCAQGRPGKCEGNPTKCACHDWLRFAAPNRGAQNGADETQNGNRRVLPGRAAA